MPLRTIPAPGKLPVFHHQLAKPLSSLTPSAQPMLSPEGFLRSTRVLRRMRNLHFQTSRFPLRNIPALC